MLVFRGWLVLLVGLLAAAVTGVIVGLQPAKYQAEAIISVGSGGSTDGALALATSDRVRQAAAQMSGLSMSSAEWQGQTTADAPGGGLIRLWVVREDGKQAMKAAASWGEALVGVLTQLGIGPGGNPAAGPRMISQPTQATRVSSQLGLKMLTSGILGLVVGLIAVLTLRTAKTAS
ncbi:MAG: hypothetical protein ABSG98_04325 [Anaerolineales bacterium]|jgi:hypothetical protein